MKLSNIKIGTKLTLGFGLVVFLILMLSVVSLIQTNAIETMIKSQNEMRSQKLERLYVAREALDQTGIAARNAFIFTDDVQAKNELDIVDQQKDIYLDMLNALTPLLAGNAEFEKIRTGLLKMAEELKRPRQYRDANKMQEYATFLVTECSPLRRQIVADIDVLLTSMQLTADKASSLAEQSIERSNMFVLIISAIAVFISLVVGFLLTKGLLKQLGGEPTEVARIAGLIASGNLSSAISIKPHDESSVMFAMNEMRKSLVGIVGQVRDGTQTLSEGASNIASGNLSLSSRTIQQAASLEETAASMEELTATVKQNADSASQANALASSASVVAVKGGVVVSQVVDTMSVITDSAKKIVDIIAVIEGIAFQTNILALNAAVEAARAGEHGRGFAVVASEVRSLAQRSATAAKEIETLIGHSVRNVEAGNLLVTQAGTTMEEIVSSVQHVTHIMGEIMSASQEQSSGIEQVNIAIAQIDQVTQQNSALVEAAATASDSLQQEVDRLSQVVSIFKLGDTSWNSRFSQSAIQQPMIQNASLKALTQVSPTRALKRQSTAIA